MSPDRVVYDCNIRGRLEYSATPSGFRGEMVSHPRFGKVEKVRLQWAEPAQEETEEDEESEE
ncbi:hypothetical protein D3C76_1596730 [compost metagenome]